MIPQLIVGTLGEVTITSEDVPMESFVGDVTVTAQRHPDPRRRRDGQRDGDGRPDRGAAAHALSTVEDFPADSLGLAAPDVTMSTELSLFGVSLPRGGVADPQRRRGRHRALARRRCSSPAPRSPPTALRQQFGRLADVVLRDWTVCIAQYIPAGVTLTAVAVDGDELVADFDIDGAIISDPALQANGTCAEPLRDAYDARREGRMPRALDFKHCPARASTGRGIRADGLSGRPCAEAPTDWSHPCPPPRTPARWPPSWLAVPDDANALVPRRLAELRDARR